MNLKQFKCAFFALLCLGFSSCSSDDNYTPIEEPQVSPVIFDINAVPYQNLSEYNFFEGEMKDLTPVYGVLPYKLTSGLFIDYAKTKTFVWMPENTSASYVNDYSNFNYPEGTILQTTHYFENVLPEYNSKLIETRLLIKKEGEWIMANYVWNDEQTEASYSTDGSFINIDFIENNEIRNVDYRVPAYPECFTCHNRSGVVEPIGPKPQNINSSYSFLDGEKNQLQKWAEFGYLNSNYPSNINSLVDWSDANEDLDLRVRSYLDINCAHCHSD